LLLLQEDFEIQGLGQPGAQRSREVLIRQINRATRQSTPVPADAGERVTVGVCEGHEGATEAEIWSVKEFETLGLLPWATIAVICGSWQTLGGFVGQGLRGV
jgi:hypothetical protein